MKRLIIIFGLLGLTCPLFSAVVPLASLDGYTGFKIKKELWICTSIAFPVDISYDVFNVDFKTITVNNSGYFVQVTPGMYTDSDDVLRDDIVVEKLTGGVLNVVGMPAGVYEFVFVSQTDDFCGLSRGEKAIVRVYLVPQLTSFPLLTNVCPGSVDSVDFNKYIPSEIRQFVDKVGWKFSYTRDGQSVSMPVKVGMVNGKLILGNNIYHYTIDDSHGEYKDKYTEMQNSEYACPEGSVYLMHTIKIREGSEYVIPDKTVSFCKDILRRTPETWPHLNVNLFSYLGSSVPEETEGTWSVENVGTYPAIYFDSWFGELDPVSGDVTIPLDAMDAVGHDADYIVFKYNYQACLMDGSVLLTFKFDNESFLETFEGNEGNRAICRNLMSGQVELSSLFGFSVPLTSGMWYEKVGPQEFKEKLYGMIDISEMLVDSTYTFRYSVNQAIDSMCLSGITSADFNLRIKDLSLANGAFQICKAQFNSGVTINLLQYIPGLDPVKISPSDISWEADEEIEFVLVSPGKYNIKASEPIPEDSTYRTQLRYKVQTDCGLVAGNIQVSTIDSIGSQHRTIQVCYTDQYAHHIDLYQILGVAGLKGVFELRSAVGERNGFTGNITLPDAIKEEIEWTGIIDAYKLFIGRSDDVQIYKFRYMPANSDVCVASTANIEIELKITKTKFSNFQ
jgi:hypothetical protein